MGFRIAGSSATGAPAGIRLGRVLGFPVRLRWSVLLLVVAVTLLAGHQLGYTVGFGFVVLLLVSVLLHELGHALTARRLGIRVRGITLEILGGYTEMVGDTPSPRAELLVSLAGPAVSLVLGAGAAAGAVVLPDGPLMQVVLLVALANLVVAFFNVLPGLPLDGGRALRAVVWRLSGDRHRGTVVAARWGQGVALVTVAAAALLYARTAVDVWGLVLLALVAVTLWQGAAASLRSAQMARRVPALDVDALTRPVVTVPSGTPLAEAQRQWHEDGPAGAALGVADARGQLVALVARDAAEAVPEHRRPWVPVDSVSRDRQTLRVVSAGLRGADALDALQTDPAAEYLVTRHDQVVGVLRAADVARMLRRAPDRDRRQS